MKTHNLIQGSAEWHAYRATVWNASEAPAMMGCSPYKTRSDLLKEMATGLTEEVTPELQKRFDDGHRFEALARPLAEQVIGEELAPVTGSGDEIIGGRFLSASFDGIDFMETVAFEHKTINVGLRACFDQMAGLSEIERGRALPLVYRVQMEQQIMVSGAERVLFVASKWDGDTLLEECHCWYYQDSKLADEIRAGWAQFAVDLANYKPVADAPKPVGRTPETLPALHIEVTGSVTASNLAEYKAHALEVLGGIKRDPSTDDEFADAERTVKWCADIEERLGAALGHARAQMGDVDALFRAVEDVAAETRRIRLDLDKAVKARKEQIRVEIVTEHSCALQLHVDGLNASLGNRWVTYPSVAFGESIKGKRTLSSIRETCSVVLAQAKIAVNQAADRFEANRASLVVEGRDWFSLFPDFAAVGTKPAEDFEALAQLRITKHLEAERVVTEAKQRAEEVAKAAIQQAAAPPVPVEVRPTPVAAPQPAPVVVAQSATPEAATVRLGEICAHVGQGFSVTSAFVEQVLGIKPAATDKAAKLYTPTDERRIYAALRDHLNGLLMKQEA